MELGRQVFFSIQKVLRKQAASVTANKTWLALHSELAIGTHCGNKITLSTTDRDDLRQFVIDKTGIDPLHHESDGDRMQWAARTSNEKLSGQAVFANEIKIFRNERPIDLVNGSACTPAGSYLVSSPENIDLNAIEAIVVVENGAAFLNWSKANLDTALRETLILYRGHDESAKDVIRLLEKMKGSIKIYAAVDFDPAGFKIALSMNADAILVPQHYETLLLEKHLNKSETFAKQNDKKSDEMIPPGWKSCWEWLHNHRVAITQEALISRGWRWGILEYSTDCKQENFL